MFANVGVVIARLAARIDTHVAAIAKLGAAIAKLGAAIAKLGAAIAKLGAAIAKLGAAIAKLGAAIAKLGAAIAKLGAAIANVGAAANTYQEPSKRFRGLAEIDLQDATPEDRPIGTARAGCSDSAVGLQGEQATERPEARLLAFPEILASSLEGSDRFGGEVPLAAVMADGGSDTQGGDVVTDAYC